MGTIQQLGLSPVQSAASPYRSGDVCDWDDDGWREGAACRHTDAGLFFPAGSTGPAVSGIEAAKAVCRSCPALKPCLRFALETNQEAGVWGGKDEDERRALRKVWRAGRTTTATAT